jgi:general stress protein 26
VQGPDPNEKLIAALRAFETLMVATIATNGAIHARPMRVAEVDAAGEIWFITEKESGKIDEIALDATALVTGQDAGRFVSVSGRLDVIHDPERVHALWKPGFDRWFSDGSERAVLLRLRPETGEYWVSESLTGMRYAFAATRAVLDGTTPVDETVDHAKVVT